MNDTEWILLDTETTGLAAPIYVVELAAQRMRGWEPITAPFKRLLNHGTSIPPEASRVNGYTREILERDGEPPLDVYSDFANYVDGQPIVACNLPYDFDQVLLPEWGQLGVSPIGQRGFCALVLAQKLLDPVLAGNCKLQTLRQYYRLSERGAHTAQGDVDTVIDLMNEVLKPLAEAWGLFSWAAVVSFCETEWYPTRILFGKHKGRDFRDALTDDYLRSWLNWLARSTNARSSAMGRWYLSELSRNEAERAGSFAKSPFILDTDKVEPDFAALASGQLVPFADPEVERFRLLIAAARQRLADLSSELMAEKHAVESTATALFLELKDEYRRRDMLATLVTYRKRFVETLLSQGEDEAEFVKSEYDNAKKSSEREYEDAVRSAAKQKDLSAEEQAEIKSIWKRLARLYHPDHVQSDPGRRLIFEQLLSVVNEARANGDVTLLREIADNPQAFMDKRGWGHQRTFGDETVLNLKAVYEAVSLAIIECIDELEQLRESEQYSVMDFCRKHVDGLESIVLRQREALMEEIKRLQVESEKLFVEIEELTGERWGV